MKVFRLLPILVFMVSIALIVVACDDDDDDNDDNDDNDDDDFFDDDDDDDDDDTGDDDDDDDDDDTGDDDDDDDDTGDDDITVFFSDDFDSYSPGAIPEPWNAYDIEGISAEVVALSEKWKGDNAVKIEDYDDTIYDQIFQMYMDFGEAPELETKFAFEYDINVTDAGGNIWMSLIDSNTLFYIVGVEADGIYIGATKCEEISLGSWYTITQIFNPTNSRIELQVDHHATPCIGTYTGTFDHVTGIMFEYWDDSFSLADYMIDNVRVYNTD